MTTIKEDALKALAGFRTVIENEMLAHGYYVSRVVDNEHLFNQGAICGGRRMCAIGSLFAGGGVPIRDLIDQKAAEWPFRESTLDEYPGIRLAYEVLNDLADRYAEKHDLDGDDEAYHGGLENLFEEYIPASNGWDRESELATQEEQEILLKLIAKAEKKIGRL